MVLIAAKKNAKKQTGDKFQEIKVFLEGQGMREITEEDKKTDWYKFVSKKPDCFNSDND
ncbi:MAG: hypothetical protein HQK91_13425 [Nitrospirae bacterium]|nr:hypothetical protein [Nitrospirota bacterium]MBF0542438.1 hypothetical protein [Nitrospirota bacterium]